ncbi:Mut7-C ubiquitin/RNAse domain-containing protein [bacterium]|nr:Mut7-C ubiquitin/RNAse domain-containing protein [candidate division CSSED10-310 bacterium]
MIRIEIRFYEELNDFLPADRRQIRFVHEINGRASVKDVVESLGVPHTEIDLILINSHPVDFQRIVRDQDRISVYPTFESLDITPLNRLRPEPLRVTRFILDVHLGRLAAFLRLAGFDTEYNNKADDLELALRSRNEQRILLTRDRNLLKRNLITHGYFVRNIAPRKQLAEVFRRFDLGLTVQPFRRCMRCNGLLHPVDKTGIRGLISDITARIYSEFHQCRSCGRVFWKGSHYDKLKGIIDRAVRDSGSGVSEVSR